MKLKLNSLGTGDLLVVLFLLVISLPIIDSMLQLSWTEENQENRMLSSIPQVSMELSAIEAYPEKFEKYYNDHFGFRDWLVRWHSILKTSLLRVSPSSKMILGKDGWLFYTGGKVIEDYRATQPLKPKQLERIRNRLEERRLWLEEQGIRYVVMVAPNKHTIYGDFLPDSMTRVGSDSRLDQIVRYLKENSGVVLIDPRDAFWRGKKSFPLYHRTDTHWNELGQFVAYQELMNQITKYFPEIRPKKLSDFRIEMRNEEGGGLAKLMGIRDVVRETNPRLIPTFERVARRTTEDVLPYAVTDIAASGEPFATVIDKPVLPKAVMFHDSFTLDGYSGGLAVFMSEHFERIHYRFQESFNAEVIKHEKPDIVIREMVERELILLGHENPKELTGAGS